MSISALRGRMSNRNDTGSSMLAVILFTIILTGILAVMLTNAFASMRKTSSARNLANVTQATQMAAQDAMFVLNEDCGIPSECAAALQPDPLTGQPKIKVAPVGMDLDVLLGEARDSSSCEDLKLLGTPVQVDSSAPDLRWASWFIGEAPQRTGQNGSLGSTWGGSSAFTTELYTVASYESGTTGGSCRVEVAALNGMAVSSAVRQPVGAESRIAYTLSPEAAAQYTLFATGNITGDASISTADSTRPVRVGTNESVDINGNANFVVDLFSSDGTRGNDDTRCMFNGCLPNQIESSASLDPNLVESYCSSLGLNDGKPGDLDPRPGFTEGGQLIPNGPGGKWYSLDADPLTGNLRLGGPGQNDKLLAGTRNGGTALCYNNLSIEGSVSLLGAGNVNIFLTDNLSLNNNARLNWLGDTATVDAGTGVNRNLAIFATGTRVQLDRAAQMRATVYASGAECRINDNAKLAGSLACQTITLNNSAEVFSRPSTASIYLKDLYSPRLIWSTQRGPVVTGVGVNNR